MPHVDAQLNQVCTSRKQPDSYFSGDKKTDTLMRLRGYWRGRCLRDTSALERMHEIL